MENKYYIDFSDETYNIVDYDKEMVIASFLTEKDAKRFLRAVMNTDSSTLKLESNNNSDFDVDKNLPNFNNGYASPQWPMSNPFATPQFSPYMVPAYYNPYNQHPLYLYEDDDDEFTDYEEEIEYVGNSTREVDDINGVNFDLDDDLDERLYKRELQKAKLEKNRKAMQLRKLLQSGDKESINRFLKQRKAKKEQLRNELKEKIKILSGSTNEIDEDVLDEIKEIFDSEKTIDEELLTEEFEDYSSNSSKRKSKGRSNTSIQNNNQKLNKLNSEEDDEEDEDYDEFEEDDEFDGEQEIISKPYKSNNLSANDQRINNLPKSSNNQSMSDAIANAEREVNRPSQSSNKTNDSNSKNPKQSPEGELSQRKLSDKGNSGSSKQEFEFNDDNIEFKPIKKVRIKKTKKTKKFTDGFRFNDDSLSSEEEMQFEVKAKQKDDFLEDFDIFDSENYVSEVNEVIEEVREVESDTEIRLDGDVIGVEEEYIDEKGNVYSSEEYKNKIAEKKQKEMSRKQSNSFNNSNGDSTQQESNQPQYSNQQEYSQQDSNYQEYPQQESNQPQYSNQQEYSQQDSNQQEYSQQESNQPQYSNQQEYPQQDSNQQEYSQQESNQPQYSNQQEYPQQDSDETLKTTKKTKTEIKKLKQKRKGKGNKGSVETLEDETQINIAPEDNLTAISDYESKLIKGVLSNGNESISSKGIISSRPLGINNGDDDSLGEMSVQSKKTSLESIYEQTEEQHVSPDLIIRTNDDQENEPVQVQKNYDLIDLGPENDGDEMFSTPRSDAQANDYEKFAPSKEEIKEAKKLRKKEKQTEKLLNKKVK